MSTIQVINQLSLKNNTVWCNRRNGKKLQKAHKRQGDLDGACGAYSIVMTLIINGLLNGEDITDYDYDGRFAVAKIAKAITKQNGLYKDGLSIEDCDTIIRSNYSKYARTEVLREKNEKLLPLIVAKIKNDIPVIVRIDFKGKGSHWLVVVGFANDSEENLCKLLCLDSGFESPKYALWNSVIDLEIRKGIYKYTYETNDNKPASIIEAIAVMKK